MSLAVMPLLIINLGGEMMYILEQRLRAQAIPLEKSRKVLEDVIRTMYNKKFVDELYKPQEMYSNHSARQIFDRLAHSSIMRLSESSMDKLYDLMTMGFKYQLVSCSHAGALLQVTLNHLEALKAMVEKTAVSELVEGVTLMTLQKYGTMSAAELNLVRQTTCRFFQDKRVKVSLFLQDGIQNADGTVILPIGGHVPPGGEVPGTIRYYDQSGNVTSTEKVTLPSAEKCLPYDPAARACALGVNLYNKERGEKAAAASSASVPSDAYHSLSGSSEESAAGGDRYRKGFAPNASAELNLLAKIIGGSAPAHEFKVNLFADNAFSIVSSSAAATSSSSSAPVRTLKFDASQQHSDGLSRIMEKFNMDDQPPAGDSGQELLDLMDRAAA